MLSLGKVYKEKAEKLNLKNACVLDPNAKITLTSKDKFDYLRSIYEDPISQR